MLEILLFLYYPKFTTELFCKRVPSSIPFVAVLDGDGLRDSFYISQLPSGANEHRSWLHGNLLVAS